MTYFEDLSPDIQKTLVAERRRQVFALADLTYPFSATFMGDPISVLGPIHRFPPYDGPQTHMGLYQLMCEGPDGKFITFATGIYIDNVPLVAHTPPRRPQPPHWMRTLI